MIRHPPISPLFPSTTPSRSFSPHTRHDVLSLVALLGWFGRALVSHDHLGAEDLAGLGRLWEPVDLEQALACYRAALTADLAGPAAHRVRLRLARWEKRAARWDAACALW